MVRRGASFRDPLEQVVLEDADLEQAVRAGSFGSFHNAGQVCMASSRHLVAASLIEQYTALLAERAEKLRVGNPAEDDDVATDR